jgi:hypothetical protein
MEARFIVESNPGRTTHIDQLDSYTQTKHYSYVLEADEFGKIIGGEWLGTSRTDHPDFAWWPTRKPTSNAVASGLISYAEVEAINREAAGMPPPSKRSAATSTCSTSPCRRQPI